MQQDRPLRTLASALLALAVCLIIFVVGLQYAYYSIFSEFRGYDDEGTMMLRVSMLIKDPAAYDSLAGVYGPFYYLHKYALHGWLHLPVSHDVNRLTTIVLWGLSAVACAVFVHRLSRSLLLAAIVQMQLILHLRAFVGEPGHPQEIAVLLISTALMFSSFVTDRRGVLPSMIGIGAATAALILVKVNLGACLAVSVGLAVLLSVPRNAVVIGLGWVAAAAGTVLPAAMMWRHLDTGWGWNFCALITLVIGASLVAAARSTKGEDLRWPHVAVAAGAATLTGVCVCGVILAWGNSLAAVANSVFLRAASFSSTFVVPAPIPRDVVTASVSSFLLAVCYAFVARRIRDRETPRLVLACVKLAYGCMAFYGLFRFGPLLAQQTIPIPFLWLVLVRTDDEAADGRRQFPRLLLCLLAAFQLLQAYPVFGSQATWSVFLIAPLAAVCVADAWNTILEIARRRLPWRTDRRVANWLPAGLSFVLLVGACVGYYRNADIVGVEAAYRQRTPLALPGASRLRVAPNDAAQIRRLTESVKANCDGFVGMPGFGSLYFWTQIEPPAAMNGAWILNLEADHQRAIVAKMQTYERPCVVHNPGMVWFWLGDRALDPSQPLVRYIQDHYKPGLRVGAYRLLLSGERSAVPNAEATPG